MKQSDIEGLGDTTVALFKTIEAWQVFKRTHDVADAKIACCEHTNALFAALDELEQLLLRP